VNTPARFEIAIVGGGLVGAAIAWGLRALGRELCILDEGDVAFRAARGNFGLIWVQGKGAGLPAYGGWTQHSAREWPAFAAELLADTGVDVALAQPGGLHVCLARDELDRRAAALDALFAQPGFERYPVEVLDAAGVARRLPGVGRDVVGGTFGALDGHCNPLKLLRALHAGVARAGGVYRPGEPVARIAPGADGFELATPAGTVVARRVVLAAGLGNAALAPMVGLAAPVRPNKGQLIALERVPRFLSLPVETIRQTDEGTVLVGDAQQEAGFDDAPALDVVATMAARAVRVFPHLAGVRVTRTWAALRVMSRDGFPLYAQSAACPGAFVASCHSGVTLAAAHARVLAPAIAAGALPGAFAPFSPERFDVPQAA
jgi:glycine/D-amino acid oxidase-like deaminating enzyme